jgi:hypothetical protein
MGLMMLLNYRLNDVQYFANKQFFWVLWDGLVKNASLAVSSKFIETELGWLRMSAPAFHAKAYESHFTDKRSVNFSLSFLYKKDTQTIRQLTFHQCVNSPIYNSPIWQFANLTICQSDISPTWQFANMTFHKHDIYPTWNLPKLHFANISICRWYFRRQHDSSIKWQYENMTFRRNDKSPTYLFANPTTRKQPFCQHDVFCIYSFII